MATAVKPTASSAPSSSTAPPVPPPASTLTSIGRGEETVASLPDPVPAPTPPHIHFDGRDFNVTAIDKHGDLHINNKRRNKHRLMHQDVVKIGATELIFS